MNAERRRHIRILQDALGLDPAERAVFLDRVCEGDPSLRKEVEARIGDYEQRPVEASPELTAAPTYEMLAGRTLGHCRVLPPLGAGGMGHVYLAEDARLGRKVALKVLAPGRVGDSHSRSRFLREARLASSFDHPNVRAVYDIGESSGSRPRSEVNGRRFRR